VTQLKLQYESRPIIAPHLLLRNIPHIPLVEKMAVESGAVLPPETLKKKKKNTMLSKESAHVEKSFSMLNEQEPGFI
jgi:hypothetical protein